MILSLRFTLFISLSFIIFFSLVWSSFSEGENSAPISDIGADRVFWNHLSYQAKNFFGKVTTDVYLTAVPAKQVVDSLISEPSGEGLKPSGESIFSLTVNSNFDPLFGSDEILNTQSWFDSNGGRALQRVRLRQGNDKWQKSYRFTKRGVYRLRKKPNDSREEKLPLDRWTKIRNHFYLYGDKGRSCAQILEPGSLLHFVSTINLANTSNPLHLCVFNKKQLHMVKVTVGGSQPLKVDYLEVTGDKQIRIYKKIEAVKISFQPGSLAPDDQVPEAFSFLGLKGDFDLYVDKITQLPIQISGQITTFGRLDIKLRAVSLSGVGAGKE